MKKQFVWLLIAMVALAGCQSVQQEETIPVKETKSKPVMMSKDGDHHVIRYYPCDSCGVVKVEKMMPKQVMKGMGFEYQIMVTNMTDYPLADIAVTDQMHSNMKFEKSMPMAKVSGNTLMWNMASLAPKDTQAIKVMVVPQSTGIVKSCADVTYRIPACAQTQVVEPGLVITKSAPSRVLLCDEIPITVTVTNPGTGTAKNVVVMDNLPSGMTSASGTANMRINVGDLAPGDSKTYKFMAKAQKTGSYKNMANAMGTGLEAESETVNIAVVQPKLDITTMGPKNEYIKRRVSYSAMVKNTGNATSANTTLIANIPSGVTDVQANMSGQVAGSRITWKLGDLGQDQSRTVSFSYVPNQPTTLVNTAMVMGDCADEVSDTVRTQVTGIAAILLEVIDELDPVQVGGTETYLITVTNQGSAPATNVKINCMLEDSMEYLSTSGVTSGTLRGSTVAMNPVASIAPGQKVSWEVNVKATKPGDVRFKVTMDSDQLTRNVEETEASNFYE